jgi:hypothetical protein
MPVIEARRASILVPHDHRRDAGRQLESRTGGQEFDIAPDVGGLCEFDKVRARDDDGVELNAAFTVEADAPYVSLVLESAGGRTVGSDRPRKVRHAQVAAAHLPDTFVSFHAGCCGVHDRGVV